MTPYTQTGFRVAPELMESLQAIKARDGVPISEQVRAILMWVESKGVEVKTARKRSTTRKRS